MSIMLAAVSEYSLTFLSLFGCSVLFVSYAATISKRPILSFSIFSTCVFLIILAFSIFASFNYNFYWILVTLIPILYFNTEITSDKNIPFASLLTIAIIVLYFLDKTHISSIPISDTVILGLNLLTMLFSMSATAFLSKERFRNSEDQILQANEKLKKMANHDTLTQLFNRRAMHTKLRELSISYTKKPSPFCIAIGDIDYFKKINDHYGHDAGDAILIALGEILDEFMIKRGIVSRWGGEEFLFCFTNAELPDAKKHLEMLRQTIQRHEFKFRDQRIKVSMTFGVEVYQEHLGIENTISRADKKLYIGKSSGRNQTV